MIPPAFNERRRFPFIVFDWDGTLADSTLIIAESLQNACRDVGEPVPADIDARFVIGLGLGDALRLVAPGLPPERHPDLVARYRHHFIVRDAHIALFDGAREMLAELDAAGFLLGIATGKSRAGLDRALAQQGVAGHFAMTRCADEGFPKPHPDMLVHLMDRAGVGPRETLMIGDTTHDLELARNAGASALAVAYGAHGADGLDRLAPLATLHSVDELRAWLHANA
ncbi:MAG: HAD-IA family hydrolase [Betaproteobacteria bacterium]